MSTRFGRRLFELFLKDYTEKIWGISCSDIRADWAEQRIRKLSLYGAITNTLFGKVNAKSLVDWFYYPKKGAGQMWEALKIKTESRQVQYSLNTTVERIHLDHLRIIDLECKQGDKCFSIKPCHLISSIALPEFLALLSPSVPGAVLGACQSLQYRAFI